MPEVKPAANAALVATVVGTAATAATAATGDAVKKTRAPKTNLLDIARGRLPLLFVHAIRFTEDAAVTTAALAKKYGTSVGKVFDIRKGRQAHQGPAAQAWTGPPPQGGHDPHSSQAPGPPAPPEPLPERRHILNLRMAKWPEGR